MQKYTFEMLPELLSKIEGRLDRIEHLLLNRNGQNEISGDYVGAKEAAFLLKFSLATLYSKVCRAEIPSYKKGNRLYFSRLELFDWIEKGKKTTLTEIDMRARKIADGMNKNSFF